MRCVSTASGFAASEVRIDVPVWAGVGMGDLGYVT